MTCEEIKRRKDFKMNFLRAILIVLMLVICDSALAMLQFYGDDDETFGKCLMPNGQSGNCIPLTKCPPLYEFLMKNKLTSDEEQFLKRCQCGYIPGVPLVCCPSAPKRVENPIAYRYGQLFSVDDLPTPDRCGTYDIKEMPHTLIVGGHQTRIYESPWMALLKYVKRNNETAFLCGGVLIHERYVLTAAHCVTGNDLRREDVQLTAVRMGEWDLNQTIDCEFGLCANPVVDVAIESIHAHEMYKPTLGKTEHDIALIRLAKRIEFTEWVKPICLPVDSAAPNRDYAGVEMQVAGWGYTSPDAIASSSNMKMKAILYGMSQDRCVKKYRSRRVQLTANQMCAGGEKGIDSCGGDSGSPLMEYNASADPPHWSVVGIVSFGFTECGKAKWPGVYTRVDKYIPWMLNTMRN